MRMTTTRSQGGGGLYERLGINMAALGCVMLDAEPLDVHEMFPESFWYYGDLPGRRAGACRNQRRM